MSHQTLIRDAVVNTARPTPNMATPINLSPNLVTPNGGKKALTICGPLAGTYRATVTLYTTPDRISWNDSPVVEATIDQANPMATCVFDDPRTFFGASMVVESGSIPVTPDSNGRIGLSVILEG